MKLSFVRLLPWLSLVASTTLIRFELGIPVSLVAIVVIVVATGLVVVREIYGRPVAIAVSKSLALDIGGFVAPMLLLTTFYLGASCRWWELALSTALYSLTASLLAKPSHTSVSLNAIAYSIAPTLILAALFGKSSYLYLVPLPSFLGILMYVDVAHFIATYRKRRATFIVGGAGALDALIVGPAVACCVAAMTSSLLRASLISTSLG